MTSATVPTPGETRDSRSRRVPARAGTDPRQVALERLRDTLLERLNAIEALAEELTAQLGLNSSERERILRDRVVVLEAAQARNLAEIRRHEEEWEDAMSTLATDRRLLAEAWERLEQLQIQYEPHADSRSPPAEASVGAAPRPLLARRALPTTTRMIR